MSKSYLEGVGLTNDEKNVTKDEVSQHRDMMVRTESDNRCQGQDVEEEGEDSQGDETGDTEPVNHLNQLQVVHFQSEQSGFNSR